jgi:hypothetical protein
MNELIGWLRDQNEGVCTYTGLQQRAHGPSGWMDYVLREGLPDIP